MVRTFQQVVELAGIHREAKLKLHLEEHVSLVKFDTGGRYRIAVAARRAQGARRSAKAQRLDRRALDGGAQQRGGRGAAGLVERERKAAEISALKEHPAVAAVLKQFPDAEITSVQQLPGAKTDDTGTG